MRLRLTVLACAISACAFTVLPGTAGAAPHHNRALTIHLLPRTIIAGEQVLIDGRLKGADSGNQVIRLYHRINPNPFFSLISTTRTDANGRYEFIRADGVVETNRSWFVRGPALSHSRTAHERVAALVSLVASANSGVTRHPIVFSGHVTPNHAGSVVLLQAQKDAGDGWTTLKRGRVGPDSNYQISYAWRTPGGRNLRVLFTGDARNIPAASDEVSLVINQAEIGDFTINTSAPIVTNGSPSTISGTLYEPGTTTPEPSTNVSLFAHVPDTGPYKLVQTATTAIDGTYSFTVDSTTNELYQARTTFAPARHSAQLFQGVQDVVNMTASSSTSTVNGHITFSGSVAPSKTGHSIELQKLGVDGDWHTVRTTTVTAGSTFAFGWTFGTSGTKEFRARITGGPVNVGGASVPVTVDVAPTALSALPTS